jgi:hypothetical protein
MIKKIEKADHRLAASVQYEGGNRVREIGHIRWFQLMGFENHLERGEVGRIDLTKGNTKGGERAKCICFKGDL